MRLQPHHLLRGDTLKPGDPSLDWVVPGSVWHEKQGGKLVTIESIEDHSMYPIRTGINGFDEWSVEFFLNRFEPLVAPVEVEVREGPALTLGEALALAERVFYEAADG